MILGSVNCVNGKGVLCREQPQHVVMSKLPPLYMEIKPEALMVTARCDHTPAPDPLRVNVVVYAPHT